MTLYTLDSQWLLSGVHSIMMEKSAQLGEGGRGVHAHPLSLYLSSCTKLWCTLQTDKLPLFLPYPYMYSVLTTIPVANWYSMAVPLGDVDSIATTERYDMNGKSQMQGGKNWILLKDINKNRFFGDSHWLEIWKNHLCPSMGSRRYDMNKSFQMQGGKNWILPK